MIKFGLGIVLCVAAVTGAGCSKHVSGALPVSGEAGTVGAKLAYEHQLSIRLPGEAIPPRIASIREACVSGRYGACNVLRISQSEGRGSLSVRIVPSGVEPISALASQNGRLAMQQTIAEDLSDVVNDNQQKIKQLETHSAQIEQLAEHKNLAVGDLIALSHERAQIQVERESLQNNAANHQRRIDTNLLRMDFTDDASGHHLGVSLGDWTNQLYDGIRDTLSMLAYGIPFLLLAFPFALAWRALWRRITKRVP